MLASMIFWPLNFIELLKKDYHFDVEMFRFECRHTMDFEVREKTGDGMKEKCMHWRSLQCERLQATEKAK